MQALTTPYFMEVFSNREQSVCAVLSAIGPFCIYGEEEATKREPYKYLKMPEETVFIRVNFLFAFILSHHIKVKFFSTSCGTGVAVAEF